MGIGPLTNAVQNRTTCGNGFSARGLPHSRRIKPARTLARPGKEPRPPRHRAREVSGCSTNHGHVRCRSTGRRGDESRTARHPSNRDPSAPQEFVPSCPASSRGLNPIVGKGGHGVGLNLFRPALPGLVVGGLYGPNGGASAAMWGGRPHGPYPRALPPPWASAPYGGVGDAGGSKNFPGIQHMPDRRPCQIGKSLPPCSMWWTLPRVRRKGRFHMRPTVPLMRRHRRRLSALVGLSQQVVPRARLSPPPGR